MGDVTAGDWPQFLAFKCDHGQGASVERGEFHFVGRAAFVDVDHSSDIAGLKLFAGKVGLLHHTIMLFDLHNTFIKH
jgi:hypothetical protein